ncbi:copper amine oxidase N-terminal domain-containing protein [Gudongella sp. DL1XJH-153]|uniref:copper amine oxidase N-terminal domain-containing protein n=1 Tax=Gudongella sp. DL1XJH-153 TaxID=3409804 RepID=UPI003BB540BC
MTNMKRVLSLVLIQVMVLTGGTMGFANEMDETDVEPISAPVEEQEFEYIRFEGEVEEVDEGDDNFRILVKRDTEEGLDALYAYIHEDMLLLSEKNMDAAVKEDIEVGMDVSVIYHKTTVMALSYPPLLGPDVVVLHDGEEHSTYVEYFNEDLLSADGSLVLNIAEETEIIDFEGNALTEEDLYERDLVIFYSIVLESYPAQTTPHKIIVMPEREEETPNAAIILTEEVITTDEGVRMIPLRMVAEALEFEVTWDATDKSVEVVKGPNWSTLTIGRNVYNFAKMLVKLESAPVLVDGSTYVPMSFVEQVLQANVEINENGSVIITE